MPDLVHLERFRNQTDPRLGRHVHHDERSRRFAYRRQVADLRSVHHERHVPVFDQGATGSCTGMAAWGCMATGPFFATVEPYEVDRWPWDERGATAVYSQATAIDPFPGSWPPDDTGSDGLSVAKVLQSAGVISGYRHAFSLDDALAALMYVPLIVGTTWHSGMYEPDADGVAHPTGPALGGHEFVMDEYVEVGARFGPRSTVAQVPMAGFTNSWGPYWGAAGRFFMPRAEFGELLADGGDVTVFVPASEPAPVSSGPADEPVSAADRALVDAVGPWAARNGVCGRPARRALRTWMQVKGL